MRSVEAVKCVGSRVCEKAELLFGAEQLQAVGKETQRLQTHF